MLKVERRKVAETHFNDSGAVVSNGRVLMRPVRTRVYRGKLASIYFNDLPRNRKILENRDIAYVAETTEAKA